MEKVKVLFVCLGNICRSPMAEGIFRSLVEKKGLQDRFMIDSAGTANYHVGELPDHRSIVIGEKYGLTLDHRVRQLKHDDYRAFDYLIGMDPSNRANMLKLAKTEQDREKVFLMMDFDTDSPLAVVEDPWYGELEGFDSMYHQLLQANQALLEHLIAKHSLKHG